MNKVPRWVFRYVGNKTFDFSSKKKDFLPKNDQIWPKIGISVHCWLIWCPVGGLVGGCGAWAVSRKTPIYFISKCLYMYPKPPAPPEPLGVQMCVDKCAKNSTYDLAESLLHRAAAILCISNFETVVFSTGRV